MGLAAWSEVSTSDPHDTVPAVPCMSSTTTTTEGTCTDMLIPGHGVDPVSMYPDSTRGCRDTVVDDGTVLAGMEHP